MCARFSLVVPAHDIEQFLEADLPEEVPPRANIAPTLIVPALVSPGQIRMLRWGLVPFWADDLSIGQRMINARAETASEKPAFREAFQKRRCVIPASGFYEWNEEPEQQSLFETEASTKLVKQPYFFHRADGNLMGFAGLWERWKQREGTMLETFTVLTTTPNELMEPFHDRMPCILEREDFTAWLTEPSPPLALLTPVPSESLAFEAADRRINNVRYEPCAA